MLILFKLLNHKHSKVQAPALIALAQNQANGEKHLANKATMICYISTEQLAK